LALSSILDFLSKNQQELIELIKEFSSNWHSFTINSKLEPSLLVIWNNNSLLLSSNTSLKLISFEFLNIYPD